MRIPNETVLKQHLINLTYYSSRRIDILVSIPYVENVENISTDIQSVISTHSFFLNRPEPIVFINKVGQLDYDAQVRVFLSVRVWVKKDQITQGSSLLVGLIKQNLDTKNIVATITQIN